MSMFHGLSRYPNLEFQFLDLLERCQSMTSSDLLLEICLHGSVAKAFWMMLAIKAMGRAFLVSFHAVKRPTAMPHGHD